MIIQPKPNWKHRGPAPVGNAQLYTWGDCTVFVENHGEPYGWHLSISTPYRNPTWEEIKAARFHLHQIPNEGS